MYLFIGLDAPNLNTTRFGVYTEHFPSGTSVRSFEHFAQSIRTGAFARYDFGAIQNLIHYGSLMPPAWNMSAIQTPVALVWGGADTLGDNTDVVHTLIDSISPQYLVAKTFVPEYAHLDFVWGEDAHNRIYPQLVDVLRQFTS